MSNTQQELIQWSQKYEVGVDEIDLQHRYFVKLIARLAALLKKTTDNQLQASLISELNAYARFHFISEENLMLQHEYPETENHKLHHYNLIQKLSIKQSMLDANQSREDVDELVKFLVDWFFDHTVLVDKQFADYLLSQQEPGD